MAKDKKMVESITSMSEDFAQWYTDVVKKAELCDYASVKGCMVIKPAGYAIWENIQKELDKNRKELDKLETKLNNPGFVNKAPAQVVEAERERANKLKALLVKLEESAAALG